MGAVLRQATRADIPGMRRVRWSVRENQLQSMPLDEEDYIRAIERPGRGWVVEVDREIVAFVVGNAGNGNLWALFVDPAHEGRGYGRRLHDVAVGWLLSRGPGRLWLTTDANTRAERFYRAAGWTEVGHTAGGELYFERTPAHAAPARIRPEEPEDIPAIRALHRLAFDTAAEADLVDALRRRAAPLLSLVAEDDRAVIGHILFSPVTLEGDPDLAIMGLAPVAVHPAHQRRGIGSALIEDGVERCRERGGAAVVVLGYPEYYPRFGFIPASHFGLACEFDVPDQAFMAMELTPGALKGVSGTVRYHPVFAEPGSG